MQESRFWVVGGDYDGDRLAPGSASVAGPFPSFERASIEWRRLTFRDRVPCARRFSIAVEAGR